MRFWKWLKSKFYHTPTPVEPDPVEPEPTPAPPAQPGKVPHVTCKSAEWFDDADRKILTDALIGLNKVLASPEFKAELLSRSYTEDFGEGGQGVWNRMVAGDQLVVGDDLNDLDFKIVMYNSWASRVIGYTYLESILIHVNKKYFADPESVASNIAHELTHTLGYTHDLGFDSSVPYTLNTIVETVWEDLGL